MLTKRTLGIAFASALALGAWSGAALAVPVTVGGVTWDSSSPLDLNIQAINFRETSVQNVNDILSGYGVIGSINGTDPATFCPGCDLNFTFQYTASHISAGANPHVVFDNGTINFFVDDTQSFNVLDPTTAGIGTPWLTLSGHTAPFNGFTATGQLYSQVNGTASNPQVGSTGIGYLDATGGPAQPFVDTNTIDDGNGGLADFSLNSAFLTQIAGGCPSTPSSDPTSLCHYPISGTATLIGSSALPVPEPGELGLLGLGLAAVGFLVRRRRKES